jgi:hypothetical protein
MTGNKKTKAYIAVQLKKYIEEVGPTIVTQICTNNLMNMLSAMNMSLRCISTFSNRVVLCTHWISYRRLGKDIPVQG